MADVQVRVGVPEDVDGVMRLSMLCAAENGLVHPNQRKILEHVWAALNRDHGIVGVIGPVGGELEGGILLRISTQWYTDRDVIEELGLFIHPDLRAPRGHGQRLGTGGRAAELCKFSKKVAEQLALPLMIGVLSNHRTAGKMRLYERIFGPPAGGYFLYNARTGDQPLLAAAE